MSVGGAGFDKNDDSAFQAHADRALSALFSAIEDVLGDELDVDLQGGVLSIELAKGGQYVINKHAPNRQIWMSSPASGASHFDYVDSTGWVETRGGRRLHDMLAQELSEATGKAIAFDESD
jgi:frataxin